MNREKERRYVAGEEDPAGAVGGRKSRRAPSKADRLAAAEAAATRDQQDAMEISIAFTRLDGTYRAAFANFQGARADWLQVGTLLVDRFRETKLLFPADKFKKYTGLSRKWRRKDAKNDIETQAGEMTSRLRRERGTSLLPRGLSDSALQRTRIPRLVSTPTAARRSTAGSRSSSRCVELIRSRR